VAVGIVVVLLLIGALLWSSYQQKQKLQAQQLITLQREHELSAVQAMMDGEERERVRIASNLHDGAGSLLSAVKLYLSALGNQHQQLAASPTYQETLGLVNDAASEIRETSHNLMPRVIQQQGLREAVRDYCNKLSKNNQIAVEFNSFGVPQRMDEAMELMVYRTIQELIGNVLKHAEATNVLVQLSFDKDLFSVTVEDNGKGFDKHNRDHHTGIGIYNVQSRVEAFHGTMDIDSSATGTSVYLEFKTTALIQEV
jgi:two-component system NarL family sensor kinase